ncbi:hypothetical protein BH24ACT3_BH24ACT3_03340 [soil metagenome]
MTGSQSLLRRLGAVVLVGLLGACGSTASTEQAATSRTRANARPEDPSTYATALLDAVADDDMATAARLTTPATAAWLVETGTSWDLGRCFAAGDTARFQAGVEGEASRCEVVANGTGQPAILFVDHDRLGDDGAVVGAFMAVGSPVR